MGGSPSFCCRASAMTRNARRPMFIRLNRDKASLLHARQTVYQEQRHICSRNRVNRNVMGMFIGNAVITLYKINCKCISSLQLKRCTFILVVNLIFKAQTESKLFFTFLSGWGRQIKVSALFTSGLRLKALAGFPTLSRSNMISFMAKSSLSWTENERTGVTGFQR